MYARESDACCLKNIPLPLSKFGSYNKSERASCKAIIHDMRFILWVSLYPPKIEIYMGYALDFKGQNHIKVPV